MIDLSLFSGQRIAVLGLGKSGRATATALATAGAEVLAWDDSADAREAAGHAGITVTDLYAADWDGLDLLVLSPGIPHLHPQPHALAERARRAGCSIVCDVELLVRARLAGSAPGRFVGITGTNGKSTTTALIGHILDHARQENAVGGNIGIPALSLPGLSGEGIYVLELSSYQLELTPGLHCDIAVLLNLSEDHLERHGGFKGYLAAKEHIFDGQTEADTAILGTDDPTSPDLRDRLCGRAGGPAVLSISAEQAVPGGVYAEGRRLIDDLEGEAVPVVDLDEAQALPGGHNDQNAAAAYAAARRLGVPRAAIADAIRVFPGLPHRQELVGTLDGIRFINDSKATNGESAARAVSSYDAIYWIAGGQAKAGGIEAVAPYFARIVHAFLIGGAAETFARRLDGQVACTVCSDLDSAVRDAHAMAAREGLDRAVVLLSPAGASFDQFANFEMRGEAFRAAVAALPQTSAKASA